MKNYLSIELKHFIANKKNQTVFIILLFLGLYYGLVDVKNYLPIEHIDEQVMSVNYQKRQKFLENTVVNQNSHFSTLYFWETFPEWNKYEGERIQFLEKKDYRNYAKVSGDYYLYSDKVISESPVPDLIYNRRYYNNRNFFGGQDGHYGYLKTASIYEGYGQGRFPVTEHTINEKTAVQTLYRASRNVLPIILTLSVLFLMVDHYYLARRHSSIVDFYPISSRMQLFSQLVLGIISGIISIGMFVPGFLIVGIKYGFGSLSYPVAIYQGNFLNNGDFYRMNLFSYFQKFFFLLFLWMILVVASVLLLNYVFKQILATMAVVTALILLEFLYNRRGIGVSDKYLYFPSSYIRIGEVVDGYRSFFYGNQYLIYKQGLFVLVLLNIVVLLVLFGRPFKKNN